MFAILHSVSPLRISVNLTETYENLVVIVLVIGLGLITYLSACLAVL